MQRRPACGSRHLQTASHCRVLSRWVADPTHRPTGHQPRHGYLRALLTGLGYDKVTTLLNNGNAVFRVTQGTPQQHAAAISVAIAGQLGLQMPVIVQDNPFDTSTLDPLGDVRFVPLEEGLRRTVAYYAETLMAVIER